MHHRLLRTFVTQAFRTNIVIGIAAFFLQPIYPLFFWILLGNLILLLWLGVAWLCLMLEFFTSE